MSKISTNISIDADLKKDAVSLFNDFGLDLSTAITLFLQQSVREQRIPFEIKKEVPNQITKAALDEFAEMKTNKDQYKRSNSFKELLEEV
ncbi:MAG: type II toxin-antitoxin system RelB/DinJ family antitoxin [Clostridia bacterium]|nr:type II toxin-antitoxin system RelB/DinJ family antitoxin [Clostridia bacterium]